jgi:predicted secreted protein
MTTNAKIGHGSLFELFDFDSSPEGYVVVGEVTNITLPALARDAVDATHTESTDGWREFIPGLKDGGEVSVEMNFVSGSATDSLIRRQFDMDNLSLVRISTPESPPTDVITFSAVATGYEVEDPLDDKIAATLTLKVSGKVTHSVDA